MYSFKKGGLLGHNFENGRVLALISRPSHSLISIIPLYHIVYLLYHMLFIFLHGPSWLPSKLQVSAPKFHSTQSHSHTYTRTQLEKGSVKINETTLRRYYLNRSRGQNNRLMFSPSLLVPLTPSLILLSIWYTTQPFLSPVISILRSTPLSSELASLQDHLRLLITLSSWS